MIKCALAALLRNGQFECIALFGFVGDHFEAAVKGVHDASLDDIGDTNA